jgi:hypothetical protein
LLAHCPEASAPSINPAVAIMKRLREMAREKHKTTADEREKFRA